MPEHLSRRVCTHLDQFAARFGNRFVLGLSGGGDSMALAVLAAQWQTRSSGQVLAVCVDHNLRAGSAHEAVQAYTWAKALGLDAKIVTITESWPVHRLQETARNRRHLVLATAAKAFGARVILLAHNQDDQAETIAFRLSRKTGLDGLAGMAELAVSPTSPPDWPCLIARPVLDVSRADLRAVLTEHSQSWLEDPSNHNLAFSRIKTRQRLSTLSQSDRLIAIGAAARALKAESDQQARALLDRCDLIFTEDNSISLDARIWLQATPQTQARALSWLIASVGRTSAAPDQQKTRNLVARLQATNFPGATLAGVAIKQSKGRIWLRLAPRRADQKPRNELPKMDIAQILAAQSGQMDQFVTLLG